MTTDADERSLLPIACTLGPDDGAQRVAEWRQLGVAAGIGRERSAGSVVLRFRDQPQIGPELHRLVTAERSCCSFLGWELVHNGSEWRVVITGSDDELDTLSLGSSAAD